MLLVDPNKRKLSYPEERRLRVREWESKLGFDLMAVRLGKYLSIDAVLMTPRRDVMAVEPIL
ncbi:hypothetical protein [Methylocystis echinoides]|uniref:Uncharacterized protein n=1 Tax=Methylocystis echinoides TaxID=29468 RepID=A0A9W6LT98_9HYPH|nr:hypothetical protein [Methylocystis echinoides]GLI94418.1 hypothetical protein LMG27198_34100 [Methylocystis echinoides]